MNRSPIEAARTRHRLAEVARRTGIHLASDSGTVTVRCPLLSHGHPDRTPSMRLYLDDDHFYCFGCAAKGDVVQWARETERLGVSAAIRTLDSGAPLANAWAGKKLTSGGANHQVPSLGNAQRTPERANQAEVSDLTRTPAERVHEALEVAWAYYTCPSLHARAGAYLAGRGIEVGVLEGHTGRAEAGHTPADADGLLRTLRARGFSNHELIDAGLAQRSPGGGAVSDFYRQRVLIPIRDDHERLVGFIGRNVGDQARWAKYKNPPRTVAYDKSINLYQPLSAPGSSRGQVVVVEGTLDAMAIAVAAIRSRQADRFCPVTQSGRELSPVQLDHVIGLHASAPVLGFDGDQAGQDSACRHALAATSRGVTVAVTVLPGDHDPASWLAEHGEAGLQAWVRDEALNPTRPAPKPVPGATFVAGYLARQDISLTKRMEAIVTVLDPGDHPVFIRSAHATLDRAAGIGTAGSDMRLRWANGRVGPATELPSEAATPLVTNEGVWL